LTTVIKKKYSVLESYLKKGGIKVRVWVDTPFLGSIAKNWTISTRPSFLTTINNIWENCLDKWICIYIPRKSHAKLGDKYWFPPGVVGKPLRSYNEILVFLNWVKIHNKNSSSIANNHLSYEYNDYDYTAAQEEMLNKDWGNLFK
jgi:hypothetical protein